MISIKIPTSLLTAVAALCLMAQPLSAFTSGNFTYVDYGTYISIVDYPTTATGAVTIPATIAGKPVTSIGSSAFQSCTGLTSVTIPSSVTSIGPYAFYYCIGLTSVTIPSSVTSIGSVAFGLCSGLTSVTIPSSVTKIGTQAFENCSGLTSVTIPSSVTIIEAQAFYYCTGLTSAYFLGNAPSMSDDYGNSFVFSVAAPDFTVFYQNGKTGFTSPTWKGYPCVGIDPAPEIDVQQPLGSSLVDGTSKKSFGTVTVGTSGTTKTFTIRNRGTANLSGLQITKNGSNAANFIVTNPAKTSIAPGGSTTFKVTFSAAAAGTRNAAIHIKSNDANENLFDIQLTGLAVAP